MSHYDTILKPVVTEKTSGEKASKDKFVFEVASDSNKIEIAKDFKSMFGVEAKSVRITRVPCKIRPRDGAMKRKSIKRAIVSVVDGSKVDLSKIK